jgi:hypothetical protein
VELDATFPQFLCEPRGNRLERQVVRPWNGRGPQVDEVEGARAIQIEDLG